MPDFPGAVLGRCSPPLGAGGAVSEAMALSISLDFRSGSFRAKPEISFSEFACIGSKKLWRIKVLRLSHDASSHTSLFLPLIKQESANSFCKDADCQ